MATPKSLVAQLHRHWEIIEDLARGVAGYARLRRAPQVLAVIAKHQPQAGPEDHAAAMPIDRRY
ncbi:MAG: hypothetical protein Kow0060_08400 [Methylohalobius crimeensis]